LARSVGIKRDLRLSKLETYAGYYFLNFKSFVGQHGDCYDRFLIRMCEMVESLNIINQVVFKILKFKKFKSNNAHNFLKHVSKNQNKNVKNMYNSMENLITHFKH